MGSKEGPSRRPRNDQDNRIESGEANTPPRQSDAHASDLTLSTCRQCGEAEITHSAADAVCKRFQTKSVGTVDPQQVKRFRDLGMLTHFTSYGTLGTAGWQDRSAKRLGSRYRQPD